MGTFLSVIAGGLITWLASWFYYKRAGDELREEIVLLKRANMVTAYMLEHPDAKVEVRRDAAGNPIGMIVSATMRTTTDSVTFEAEDSVEGKGP